MYILYNFLEYKHLILNIDCKSYYKQKSEKKHKYICGNKRNQKKITQKFNDKKTSPV